MVVATRGPTVRLREGTDADVELVNRWLSDERVWSCYSTYPEPVEAHSVADVADLLVMIELPKVGSVGFVALRQEEPWNSTGIVDIVIGDVSWRNRSVGVEAITLFLDHLFRERRLHRVEAHVAEQNTSCLSAMRKYGFIEEGFLRDRFNVGGRWRGVLIFRLLESEFRSLRVANRILSRCGIGREREKGR